MRACLPIALFAATVLLAGCDQKSGNEEHHVSIAGKEGNVTISGNGQHMTMKADNGKTVVEVNSNGIGNAKMPGFAPLYPGAKVEAAVTASENGGGTVSFQTTAQPADIIAFYKQKTGAAGLAEKLNMSSEGNLTFMAADADGKKTVQVVAAKADSGSHVQVYWQGAK
jgi:hypothetical protein